MIRLAVFAGRMFAAIVILALPIVGSAQTVNGSFRGTVTDQSGAGVAGASVTMTNDATGVSRQTATDNSGDYIFNEVPSGAYTFTVSDTGFETVVSRGVTLLVNQHGLLDFVLHAGSVSEKVTVTAQTPLADTVSSTVGTVIERQQVAQLPLNGRQFTQLILLSPGAADMSSGQHFVFEVNTDFGAVSPPVNGARAEMNNFTIDGVENNELFLNFAAFSPPPDAIQEFKVQTNISSSEYGRSAGANVNVITRSGGNQFHGDAWEFVRNTVFDAKTFFNPNRDIFHQNQFGVAAGGPIRKDKVWAFGWYEGFRKSLGQSLLGRVPTTAELAGDFSAFPPIFNPFSTHQTGTDAQGNPIFAKDPFPNNQIPSNLLNASAQAIAAQFYPAPNFNPPFTGAINYINTQPVQTDANQFGVRIDAALQKNTTLFGRFSFSDGTKISPTLTPTEPVTLVDNVRQAVIGITHTFNPSTVLDVRGQYLRVNILLTSPIVSQQFLSDTGLLNDFPGQVGTGPIQPNINVSDAAPMARSGPTNDGPANYQEYKGTLTKTLGKHTVAAGGSLFHVWIFDNCAYADMSFDNLPTSDPQNISTTGSGLASFLLGVPSGADREEGDASMQLRGNYYGAFINDEWKATPKLTVNLGLRYDYAQPLEEARNQMSTLDWVNSTPQETIWLVAKGANPTFPLQDSGFMASGVPYKVETVPNGLFYPDRNDFAPRVGIAYRLPHDAVLRTGYGIFYDYNQTGIQKSQEIMGQWPFGFPFFTLGNVNQPTAANPTPTNILGTNVFPPFVANEVPPSNPGFAVNRHDRTPYMQQWNIGIDKSFRNDWLVSVTYVGSKGTHLTNVPTFNVSPDAGPGPIDSRLPQFGAIHLQSDNYNSSYNAAQLKVEKRYTNGLSILLSYTYSKCLDLLSSTFGSTQPSTGIQEVFNPNTNHGPCDFDLTHNLVINSVYELPFGPGKRFLNSTGAVSKYLFGGWQITGIVTLNNGFPVSLSTGGLDVANIGTGGGQRPSITGSLLPAGFQQTPQHWFDTSAVFLQPFTFGNLGRNTIRQDGYQNFDFGLFKHIPIMERANLEFRSEFFNLFNHPNFGAPDTNFQSLTFGQVLTQVGQPRVVQFGLKLQF